MILLTGATGKIGRELIKHLLDAGKKITAVTRDPKSAQLPAGVQIVAEDPSRAGALKGKFKGVEAIVLNPAAMENTVSEVVSLAHAEGVRRAVLISAITVEYGGGYQRFAQRFKAIEDTVKASGLEWTFLRAADFAANSMIWAPQIRATGVVRGAYGKAMTAPIHHRDIAAMAAQTLLHDGHAFKAYAITGPQSLSQFDRARIIGEAIKSPIHFEEISAELARASMLAQGAPPEIPDRMLGYLSACLEAPGPLTPTVRDVLGRPPLEFSQWAAENAHAFTA
jgi:uncharacterized protein YbjT (DUF2867 family)